MTEQQPSYWRGVRTLVTGGLGFIGSNLAHRLHALGAHGDGRGLADPRLRRQPLNLDGLGTDVEVNIGDLRDRDC